MRKNLTQIGLVLLLAALTACQMNSPPNLANPHVQPETIQDALLLEAWQALYHNDKTVPLWGGQTISGQELAQYVLDKAIPIIWDAGNVCDGDS